MNRLLKGRKATLSTLVILLSLTLAGPTRAADILAITHVTLIDGTDAPARPDLTVIVNAGRIASIAPSTSLSPPTNAVVIDGAGKYLIPGLWDMHAHWSEKDYLPLFLANGVTGIRMMVGLPIHHEWKKDIQDGRLLGPRLYIASMLLDGPKPVWPGSIAVSTPSQAREAVSKVKQEGAEFVKVYERLPRDAYFAIADQARKENIPFVGHIPLGVSAEEASIAGQRSVEHLTGIPVACSTQESRLLQMEQTILAAQLSTNQSDTLPEEKAEAKLILETYSQAKADSLFLLLKTNHTWQCPTLTVLRNLNHLTDGSLTNDTRVRFLPRWMVAGWNPARDFRFKSWTPEDYELQKQGFSNELAIVRRMHRVGVEFLAGTDVGNPYCFPGFSLHDELQLLVETGFTPMEALQTATRNAARFMGREHDLGTVEPGKFADMVLLDGNPLQAIGNTRKIAAVIYGGRLFSRSALDEMLSNAEVLAAKTRFPLSMALADTMEQRGIDACIQQYHELKASESTVYDVSEGGLNSFGYELLRSQKVKEAIQIFKLNAEAYPGSWNVYDSLAEAYFNAGDKQLAIKNYQKSLELNPNNSGAVEKLKQLKL